MSAALKIVMLLFCVPAGEGRWLRSLLDLHREETASPAGSADEDEGRGRAAEPGHRREAPGLWRPSVPDARRPRRAALDSRCGLRSILLQVRDLGLGYDSDETVLFKFCSGACPHVRSNHDLTLNNLVQSGVLSDPAHGELWHGLPCCRPTHHEDLAFLDNAHRWHKVEKLSAAACGCVG
ncbi:persephin [Lampris incognitus]|uniref:persephin n=1 Tax=Lampris incognitus TaxID=2546036 RepID=UPI0024B62E99|nr:persephin [Lampris incognitus]